MQTHILVVDDEDTIRHMMTRVLQYKGHAVSQAASGQAAFEKAQQNSFDLVLTDLIMPGMNGLELAQKLIAKDPHCPIIMMSAYADPEDINRALKAGISDYIVKPFNLEDALELIDLAIEKRLKKSFSPSDAKRINIGY